MAIFNATPTTSPGPIPVPGTYASGDVFVGITRQRFNGTVWSGVAAAGQAATAVAAGSTPAIDSSLADIFTWTPTVDSTITITPQITGQRLSLIVTHDTTVNAPTLTFGTGFKTTGTLATATVPSKVFALTFVSDGTSYTELSRTTAM